ncbi:response regulator [Bacillus niameyensis]|uniref:response regulator n=1 Tax=Bacillus niameyensis TaxID=1522308 RepID=UPI00078536C0|nr:response regulator transcription factor [Bacillus niameyensis]
MISILLADDHSIVRSGIKLLIDSQTDMKVNYEAENGEEAVLIALEKNPDIVIMDLNMPKINGLVATRQIKETKSDIKIIVLTMHDDREYIFRVLQAGASSYLLKSNHDNDLIEAIRTVHQGGAYLYPEATKHLLEDYIRKSNEEMKNLQILTGREQAVLSYLAKGYTNREISEQLFLSIKTIESHRSKIMEKLDLKSRPDLVKYAIKNGLLDFVD